MGRRALLNEHLLSSPSWSTATPPSQGTGRRPGPPCFLPLPLTPHTKPRGCNATQSFNRGLGAGLDQPSGKRRTHTPRHQRQALFYACNNGSKRNPAPVLHGLYSGEEVLSIDTHTLRLIHSHHTDSNTHIYTFPHKYSHTCTHTSEG